MHFEGTLIDADPFRDWFTAQTPGMMFALALALAFCMAWIIREVFK